MTMKLRVVIYCIHQVTTDPHAVIDFVLYHHFLFSLIADIVPAPHMSPQASAVVP